MAPKDMRPDAAAEAAGGEWYTVAEAAEYLQVSQPTIFRWMKDATLSFYKVGGKTRFSKQGLDAVIEKTTGRKEADAARGRCASCGHSTLLAGRLRGAGLLYFAPERTKFWVFDHSFVPTTARVCPACGYIQLHADAEKLGRLRPDGEREDDETEE